MPAPDEYNHPQLVIFTQQTATAPARLTLVCGNQQMALDLTTAQVWNINRDSSEALWRIYGPSKPPRDNY